MYRIIDIPLDRNFPLDAGNKLLIEERAPAHIIDTGVSYHLIDISVNKGNGVQKACEMFDLRPETMIAIGDNLNDIDMFRVTGYSIALGNAPDSTKKNADYVCKNGYGAGFTEAIEYLFQKDILRITL